MVDTSNPANAAIGPMAYIDGQRVSAAAPLAEEEIAFTKLDRDLDAVCEDWVVWCRTRRLYGPAPLRGSVLGRMTGTSSRPLKNGGSDAVSSAELAAFHIAFTCQPDALDKRVFRLYYVERVKPVKSAAAALGIGRAHFYAVLAGFRRRVYNASLAILEENQSAVRDLPSRRDRGASSER